MCGSLKEPILYSKLAKLKHDLKIYNTRLTDNLKKANRARIDWQFAISRKNVFRNWRGKQAEIKDPPHIDRIRTFWANIWGKQTPINLDSEWYRELEKSYIPNTALHKDYEITDEVFNKYVKRMPNNKAPGPDLIVPFWIKKLTPLHSHIQSLLRESYNGVLELPDWLITSRTILTAKNTDTHLEKN